MLSPTQSTTSSEFERMFGSLGTPSQAPSSPPAKPPPRPPPQTSKQTPQESPSLPTDGSHDSEQFKISRLLEDSPSPRLQVHPAAVAGTGLFPVVAASAGIQAADLQSKNEAFVDLLQSFMEEEETKEAFKNIAEEPQGKETEVFDEVVECVSFASSDDEDEYEYPSLPPSPKKFALAGGSGRVEQKPLLSLPLSIPPCTPSDQGMSGRFKKKELKSTALRSTAKTCPLVPTQGGECISSNAQEESGNKMEWLQGPVHAQRQAHLRRVLQGFYLYDCRCDIASRRGSTCCLNMFSKEVLMNEHILTYGRQNKKPPTCSRILASVQTRMCALRVPHRIVNGMQTHAIPSWKIAGIPVCREAFGYAVGGTFGNFRKAITLTLAGSHPQQVEDQKMAALATRRLLSKTTSKTEWSISWWMKHLLFQDWLPNEYAIQYRGLAWCMVYREEFAEVARIQDRLFGYRQWKRALPLALSQLQRQFYPTWDAEGRKLKLVRSARHSKFPECTDCQRLRKAYVDLAKMLSSSKEVVDQAHAELVAHSKAWQEDREYALNLRNWATAQSDTVYQCDDKCGSFWQKLPVGSDGRDNKDNCKAAYHFSIQANVVAGHQGLIRFACVPKNVATGGNFGITNLLMVLRLMKEQGKLGPHKTKLIRHTDGGPDNVTMTTHVLHWLLVYVGVFEEVLWFRFKAGHSHTEVADRLFSIMKRLFESDSQSRVGGIQSIPELLEKLRHEFRNEKETLSFEFDFANWDIAAWLKEQQLTGEHTGIQSQLVYRYKHEKNLKIHGCVKVQYKRKVAWTGNSVDAEFGPLEESEMEVPTEDGEAIQKVKVNKSTKNGVRFVLKPPDLTKEPKREELKTQEFDPAKAISLLLWKRGCDLDSGATEYWRALEKFHRVHGANAEDVPEMPHQQSTASGAGFTFQGSPQKFLPILKSLARFPRVLSCAQDFENQPPETWALAAASEANEGVQPEGSNAYQGRGHVRRDPRMENTISHEDYSAAELKKNMEQAETENFASNMPVRVEEVISKHLYFVELDEPEGGVRLGLAEASDSKLVEGVKKWVVKWFVLDCRDKWRAKNPAFKTYTRNGRRLEDVLEAECFRIKVEDAHLTAGSVKEKFSAPKLTQVFSDRLLRFASAHNLGAPTQPQSRRKRVIAEVEEEEDDDAEEDDAADELSDAAEEEDDVDEEVQGHQSQDPPRDSSDDEADELAATDGAEAAGVLNGGDITIGENDPILLVEKKWLDLILSGKKTMEVRGMENKKNVKKHLWLCANGSFKVSGRVFFAKSVKLSSASAWRDARSQHLVESANPPYRNTYGWQFSQLQHVKPAIQIERRKGAQIIQYGPMA